MFVTEAVDPAVDAGEPGGDLVDRTVEVVDPALQRDGELDEVAPAAAEQRQLGGARPPDPKREHDGGDATAERRLAVRAPPAGDRDTQLDGTLGSGTEEDRELDRVVRRVRLARHRLRRPPAGLTFSPNGSVGKLLNVTVFVSPALISSIVAVLTIDFGCFWIVSCTSTSTRATGRCSWTETSNSRLVDAWIVVSARWTSVLSAGSTFTPRCRCRARQSACRRSTHRGALPDGVMRALTRQVGRSGRT